MSEREKILTTKELADMTGLTLSGVRSRLKRNKEELKQYLVFNETGGLSGIKEEGLEAFRIMKTIDTPTVKLQKEASRKDAEHLQEIEALTERVKSKDEIIQAKDETIATLKQSIEWLTAENTGLRAENEALREEKQKEIEELRASQNRGFFARLLGLK